MLRTMWNMSHMEHLNNITMPKQVMPTNGRLKFVGEILKLVPSPGRILCSKGMEYVSVHTYVAVYTSLLRTHCPQNLGPEPSHIWRNIC